MNFPEGLVSRDRLGCPVQSQPCTFSTLRSNLVRAPLAPPTFRDIEIDTIQHRPTYKKHYYFGLRLKDLLSAWRQRDEEVYDKYYLQLHRYFSFFIDRVSPRGYRGPIRTKSSPAQTGSLVFSREFE